MTIYDESSEWEMFANSRSESIAKRLAFLSDKEFDRYQALTTKQEIRIAKRFGLDFNELDDRLISLTPEQLNAFALTHIRWYAHFLEFMRRNKGKYDDYTWGYYC